MAEQQHPAAEDDYVVLNEYPEREVAMPEEGEVPAPVNLNNPPGEKGNVDIWEAQPVRAGSTTTRHSLYADDNLC